MTETRAKRYDLMTNYRCGTSIEEMERADDGEWMRYEDHDALLTSHADLLAALKEIAGRDCLDSGGVEGWTCRKNDGTGLWCEPCIAKAALERAEAPAR